MKEHSEITTFENGTTKLLWVNEISINFLDGVGVLIVDPSVSSALATAASSPPPSYLIQIL